MRGPLVLSRLFQPFRIGNVELRNRVVMVAMATRLTANGRVTQRFIDYYGARAKGGAGLIITEGIFIHPFGVAGGRSPNIYHDRFLPGLKALVDTVHGHGAKICAQLVFIGLPQTTGMHTIPVPNTFGTKARGLAVEEIKTITRAYGEAAARAKLAGFDLVEIHACHGSLVCLFLSPYYNRRTDEYGEEAGRTRLPAEILASIKDKAGADFPVLFRINGDDFAGEKGVTMEVARANAKRLEDAGAAGIDVSSGLESKGMAPIFPPIGMSTAYRWDLAAGIKKGLSIPVIVSGGITDPRKGEALLQEGKADLIGFGRPLIADPDLPNKAKEGRFDEIRPCIRCCQGCAGRLATGLDITCLSNPEVGHEGELGVRPTRKARKAKKVLVVGGGPAGLEAAIVATRRGHKVILCERSSLLGGQFCLAIVPPGKGEMKNLIDYFEKQIGKLGVEVRLNQEVTSSVVESIKPDVIIVAAGASPAVPHIPGITGRNVVTAADVLGGRAEAGKKTIIVGGGAVGSETALFLAEQGKQVTIVEMSDEFCRDLVPMRREVLLKELSAKGVQMVPGTMVKEIVGDGVITLKGPFGALPEGKIVGDTMVLAMGVVERKQVAEQLDGKAAEFYIIGDCSLVGTALDAIHDGFNVACKI